MRERSFCRCPPSPMSAESPVHMPAPADTTPVPFVVAPTTASDLLLKAYESTDRPTKPQEVVFSEIRSAFQEQMVTPTYPTEAQKQIFEELKKVGSITEGLD